MSSANRSSSRTWSPSNLAWNTSQHSSLTAATSGTSSYTIRSTRGSIDRIDRPIANTIVRVMIVVVLSPPEIDCHRTTSARAYSRMPGRLSTWGRPPLTPTVVKVHQSLPVALSRNRASWQSAYASSTMETVPSGRMAKNNGKLISTSSRTRSWAANTVSTLSPARVNPKLTSMGNRPFSASCCRTQGLAFHTSELFPATFNC